MAKPAPAPPTAAPETAPGTPTDAPPAPERVVPGRRVALAVTGCRVYFGDALARIMGGEWVTDAERVRVVSRDHNFVLVDIDSPAHLDQLMAEHAAKIEKLKADAKALGYIAIPHGLVELPKR